MAIGRAARAAVARSRSSSTTVVNTTYGSTSGRCCATDSAWGRYRGGGERVLRRPRDGARADRDASQPLRIGLGSTFDLGVSSTTEGNFATFTTDGTGLWVNGSGWLHGNAFDPPSGEGHSGLYVGLASTPPMKDEQTGHLSNVVVESGVYEGRWTFFKASRRLLRTHWLVARPPNSDLRRGGRQQRRSGPAAFRARGDLDGGRTVRPERRDRCGVG